MGLITGAIIAGVVVAGAGIAAAQAKKSAANKAAKARSEALSRVRAVEPTSMEARARRADEDRYRSQLDLQRRVEPNAAGARESGLKELAASVRTPTDQLAEGVAAKAYQELAQSPAELDALRTKLLSNAKEELDRGAELPPEFQAELVQAGLETSGASGVGVGRRGAAGQTQRRLIGSAGLELQERRRANAQQAMATDVGVQSARQQVLAGLSSQLMGIGQARQARATTAIGVTQALMPESGLSGREVVGLEVNKQNTANQIALGQGEIAAGKAMAKGQYIADLAGAAASGVTTGLGAYGAGAGGGGGGFLGGAFGGGGGGAAPSAGASAAYNPGGNLNMGSGNYYSGGVGYTLR